MPRQTRFSRIKLLSALAFVMAPLAAQAGPAYTVAPVGDPNAPAGQAMALNDSGTVVGFAFTPDFHTNAYASSKGTTTSLHPADPSIANSTANAVNASGVAAGQVGYKNGPIRAAVLSSGGAQVLGTLGGENSSANGINAGGQVVGRADTAGGDVHAFLSQGGMLSDLGTLGGRSSEAFAINDNGFVTGYADIDDVGNFRAFLYANGTMQALGTFGGNYSTGYAINNSGMVAGFAFLAGDVESHAFLYKNGSMLDLGGFGGSENYARGINDAGDVVGTGSYANGDHRAFVYRNGSLQDLNGLIDASLGWTLTDAVDINDKGQIAVRGCRASGQCADLLLSLADTGGDGAGPNPVPEPEAFSAGIAGLALLGVVRRRRQRR